MREKYPEIEWDEYKPISGLEDTIFVDLWLPGYGLVRSKLIQTSTYKYRFANTWAFNKLHQDLGHCIGPLMLMETDEFRQNLADHHYSACDGHNASFLDYRTKLLSDIDNNSAPYNDMKTDVTADGFYSLLVGGSFELQGFRIKDISQKKVLKA